MNPSGAPVGGSPALRTQWKTETPVLNGVSKMQLIQEALSRARMRLPQAGRTSTSTEANRSARMVAVEARRRAARELGTR